MAVLKFSIPVILLDEILKVVSRSLTGVGGKFLLFFDTLSYINLFLVYSITLKSVFSYVNILSS